jgi:hypothetical protein
VNKAQNKYTYPLIVQVHIYYTQKRLLLRNNKKFSPFRDKLSNKRNLIKWKITFLMNFLKPASYPFFLLSQICFRNIIIVFNVVFDNDTQTQKQFMRFVRRDMRSKRRKIIWFEIVRGGKKKNINSRADTHKFNKSFRLAQKQKISSVTHSCHGIEKAHKSKRESERARKII